MGQEKRAVFIPSWPSETEAKNRTGREGNREKLREETEGKKMQSPEKQVRGWRQVASDPARTGLASLWEAGLERAFWGPLSPEGSLPSCSSSPPHSAASLFPAERLMSWQRRGLMGMQSAIGAAWGPGGGAAEGGPLAQAWVKRGRQLAGTSLGSHGRDTGSGGRAPTHQGAACSTGRRWRLSKSAGAAPRGRDLPRPSC